MGSDAKTILARALEIIRREYGIQIERVDVQWDGPVMENIEGHRYIARVTEVQGRLV